MQYGLTVDLLPRLNPLSESEWQAHFPDQAGHEAVGRTSFSKTAEFICILVKSDDKPILMVPLLLKEQQEQGLIDSLVNETFTLSRECGNFFGGWFTSLMFGRRMDKDQFQGKYVIKASSVVPGSALHKVALEQAFRVYTSLVKTMPVVPLNDPEFDASLVRAAAAENLV